MNILLSKPLTWIEILIRVCHVLIFHKTLALRLKIFTKNNNGQTDISIQSSTNQDQDQDFEK